MEELEEQSSVQVDSGCLLSLSSKCSFSTCFILTRPHLYTEIYGYPTCTAFIAFFCYSFFFTSFSIISSFYLPIQSTERLKGQLRLPSSFVRAFLF